jgi:hypothetical protein
LRDRVDGEKKMMANLRSYNSELESKMETLKTTTDAQINTFTGEMAAKN